MIAGPTTGVTCRRRRMESRKRREEEKKNTSPPEVFLSLSMNCRSSIAADGGRVWCMGRFGGRSSHENRMEEMRPFCPRSVRIRMNRPDHVNVQTDVNVGLVDVSLSHSQVHTSSAQNAASCSSRCV
uniref:Uncharacterized protein n=1 Tax=Nelumbo nucifera TaxID=4432 RepID=A0A822XD80_NELNU|nr:TPA_asm: hypothetical protein HUJ06_019733 [Nelumbo nucifera]